MQNTTTTKPMGKKKCYKCKKEKELKLFVQNGKSNLCKECHRKNNNKKLTEIDFSSFYMPI